MTKYIQRPNEIEATQWFENGDHPDDNREYFTGSDGKQFLGEGKVVRYYRHPSMNGQTKCKECGAIMHDHGWIDKQEDGETVCPGDFVISGLKNTVYYVQKPDLFNSKYE